MCVGTKVNEAAYTVASVSSGRAGAVMQKEFYGRKHANGHKIDKFGFEIIAILSQVITKVYFRIFCYKIVTLRRVRLLSGTLMYKLQMTFENNHYHLNEF